MKATASLVEVVNVSDRVFLRHLGGKLAIQNKVPITTRDTLSMAYTPEERLDIPVIHGDQHGTAVVVLAALLNALRLTKQKLERLRIVIAGAGMAGMAITQILLREMANTGDSPAPLDGP